MRQHCETALCKTRRDFRSLLQRLERGPTILCHQCQGSPGQMLSASSLTRVNLLIISFLLTALPIEWLANPYYRLIPNLCNTSSRLLLLPSAIKSIALYTLFFISYRSFILGNLLVIISSIIFLFFDKLFKGSKPPIFSISYSR